MDCFVNVQARLANGALLSITSGDAVPQGLSSGDNQVMLVGDQGVLTIDRDGSIWIHQEETREMLELTIPDSTVAAEFVSAVKEGGQNPHHHAREPAPSAGLALFYLSLPFLIILTISSVVISAIILGTSRGEEEIVSGHNYPLLTLDKRLKESALDLNIRAMEV